MLAVCEDNTITMGDIPNESSFQQRSESFNSFSSSTVADTTVIPYEEEELLQILKNIQAISEKGETANRRKITEMGSGWKRPLTEQQIRSRLDILETRGYIVKNRGRFGTKLTQLGLRALQ